MFNLERRDYIMLASYSNDPYLVKSDQMDEFKQKSAEGKTLFLELMKFMDMEIQKNDEGNSD